jgi:transaldolase
VAAFKRAYEEFQRRGLRARLLGAAIRHHLHWSELIGGDVVITMPASWQRRFNDSDIEVRPRMDDPVDPVIVRELLDHFPDFHQAYEPDGLTTAGFDTFGPTVRTLRAFIGSYHELLHQVTDAMLPNPDVRRA